jgi:hypothetical protein
MLVAETSVPSDLFDKVMALICLALGQDDIDMMPEQGWEDTTSLLAIMLGPLGGRRGELAIRNILEGKPVTISNNRTLKLVDEDRKLARGAIM